MEQEQGVASWRYEHRVEILLSNNLVQNRIGRHTRGRRGEPQVFGEIKKAFSHPHGLIWGAALLGNTFLQQRKSLRPGLLREEQVEWPIGSTIVAVLCSFADRDQELVDIEQGTDGCTFSVSVDTSTVSLPGVLTVGVVRDGGGSFVAAEIQLREGGWLGNRRKKSILDALWIDIPRFASLDEYL